jgi:hypothetical protein
MLKRTRLTHEPLDVVRDNQKASIEVRSFRVQVAGPAGKIRKFIARMLYDSQTKLFYWECFELYDNHNTNSHSEARTFADVSTIYLSNDRMRRFHTTIPQPLVVSESADRYDTLGEAQNALLPHCDRHRGFEREIPFFRGLRIQRGPRL